MPVQVEANPFGLVYAALWDLAMRSRDLATRVKEGNRLRYDSIDDRNIGKEKIQDSDVPELVLVVQTMIGQLHNTSSSSACTRQYAWQLSSGDYRYTQNLSPIEWALFCAMTGWRTTLTGLRWRDKGFVKKLELAGGPTGTADPQNNRNLKGWSTVWAVSVDMVFDQADLDAEIK